MTQRGALDPSTYWRRRIFLCLLVMAVSTVTLSIIQNNREKAPASDSKARATSPASVDQSTVPEPRESPSTTFSQEECTPSAVRVVPYVDETEAIAGRPVKITLSLTTTAAECRWTISPKTLVLKINSEDNQGVLSDIDGGTDGDVWTTQICRTAVPTRNVILGSSSETSVSLTWFPYPRPRRPDGTYCPGTSEWMTPGQFTVFAAAFSGEPSAFEFRLQSTHDSGARTDN